MTVPSTAEPRHLRPEEIALFRSLLTDFYPIEKLNSILMESRVTDMQDGGMGSVRFFRSDRRTLSSTLLEMQYQDIDSVLVTISVNVDQEGDLFEVDFWKVDFSPLKRYPNPSEVSSTRQ